MHKLLREPFIHFLAIGTFLFVLYSLVDDRSVPDDNSIIVSQEKIDYLSGMFGKTWQRPPTGEELDGLIEDHIKEEVFYREALRLGLDEDDLIIRRRMRQKMEFVAEDISSTIEPTSKELEAFLQTNAERFEVPPRISFRQVYLNPENRQGNMRADAQKIASRLQSSPGLDISSVGDRLMISSTWQLVTPFEISRTFGEEFSDRLVTMPVGTWTGPLESGYGYHIVIVDKIIPGYNPSLEEVRTDVERELMNERRLDLLEKFYESLRANYEVIIERDIVNEKGSLD